jgi:hypothetical protein
VDPASFNPDAVANLIKSQWLLGTAESVTVTVLSYSIIATMRISYSSGGAPDTSALAAQLTTSLPAEAVSFTLSAQGRRSLLDSVETLDARISTGATASRALAAEEELTSPIFLSTAVTNTWGAGAGSITVLDTSFDVSVSVALVGFSNSAKLAQMMNQLPAALNDIVHGLWASPPPPQPPPLSPPPPQPAGAATVVSQSSANYGMAVGLAVGLSVLAGVVSYAVYRLRKEQPKSGVDSRRKVSSTCFGEDDGLAHKPLIEEEEEVAAETSDKAKESEKLLRASGQEVSLLE